MSGNVSQPARTRLISSSKLRGTASLGRGNGHAVGQATSQCGRPCSRNGPRARHPRSFFNTSSRTARQLGDHTGSHPIDPSPAGAAQRPPSRLEHRTLGIRLRELAGYLPLTVLGVKAGGGTIQ